MKPKIALALTGSFCTVGRVIEQLPSLLAHYDVFPVLSEHVRDLDTRFFRAQALRATLTERCAHPPIDTLTEAEPIGPRALFDLLIIAPCTGNTLNKLALGITDSTVTLAAKAHLRNRRPLLIAPATNDALAASAKGIGLLLNTKNVYFVPFSQDDCQTKESSLVADFSLLCAAADAALAHRQLQPLLTSPARG